MWHRAKIADDRTHHTVENLPLYDERFEEVLAFHPPGLAAVRRAAEAWHIDASGSPAYARRFLQTFGFYEERAPVRSDDGWHHIATDGSDVYAHRLDWCGNFQLARCTVRDRNGNYFHLRADGRPAYATQWKYAGDFRDGFAVVQGEDGRSTHIGLNGDIVHGRWFEDLDVFHKGAARARDTDGWMHVDSAGRPLYARRFAMVEPFYNGQARVERFDGAREVIDPSGRALVSLRGACSDAKVLRA